MAFPYRRDETDDASGLFGRVDLVAGARLDPADVDDVGARCNGRVDPLESRLVLEGGAAVIERVGRAVDDRHDEPVGRRERPLPEP